MLLLPIMHLIYAYKQDKQRFIHEMYNIKLYFDKQY
jgi:hypothetical protein